jgi:hypothetical protein
LLFSSFRISHLLHVGYPFWSELQDERVDEIRLVGVTRVRHTVRMCNSLKLPVQFETDRIRKSRRSRRASVQLPRVSFLVSSAK